MTKLLADHRIRLKGWKQSHHQPESRSRKGHAVEAVQHPAMARDHISIVLDPILTLDEIKKQVKKSEITEDDQKQLEKELQDLTDKRCKEVDELTAKKEQELMAV